MGNLDKTVWRGPGPKSIKWSLVGISWSSRTARRAQRALEDWRIASLLFKEASVDHRLIQDSDMTRQFILALLFSFLFLASNQRDGRESLRRSALPRI